MAQLPTTVVWALMISGSSTALRPASNTTEPCATRAVSSRSLELDGSVENVEITTCARYVITERSIIYDIDFTESRQPGARKSSSSRGAKRRRSVSGAYSPERGLFVEWIGSGKTRMAEMAGGGKSMKFKTGLRLHLDLPLTLFGITGQRISIELDLKGWCVYFWLLF